MKKLFVILGGVVCLVCSASAPATSVVGLDTIERKLNLNQFKDYPIEQVKIAIIDKGFESVLEPVTARDPNVPRVIAQGALPAGTTLVEDYSPYFEGCRMYPVLEQDPHGGIMAQTVWAGLNNNPAGPQFFLLSAKNSESLDCAERYAREIAGVHIILHSQSYPYDADFDGRGFINSIINRATAAKILWINAAGNYGGMVYNGPVPITKTFKIRATYDRTPLSIYLAWSGASEDPNVGTDRDLDATLMQVKGKIRKEIPLVNYKQVLRLSEQKQEAEKPALSIASSTPTAIEEVKPEAVDKSPLPYQDDLPAPAPKDTPEGESVLARYLDQPDQTPAAKALPAPAEGPSLLVANVDNRKEDLSPFEAYVDLQLPEANNPLDPNNDYYLLTVKRVSGNFNSTDNLRVTVVYEGRVQAAPGELQPLRFDEASNSREIMAGADNPHAVTVGNNMPISSKGKTMDGRIKPEILMPLDSVEMSDGQRHEGTSVSAAFLASAAVALKAVALYHDDLPLTWKTMVSFTEERFVDGTYTQSAAPGYLPAKHEEINVEQFKNRHVFGSAIVDSLRAWAPTTVFRYFLTPDGYLLTTTEEPGSFRNIFSTFPYETELNAGRLSQWEFYLTMENVTDPYTGVSRLEPRWDPRNNSGDSSDQRYAYPWERNEFKRLGLDSRSYFVRMMKLPIQEQNVTGEKKNLQWRTPSADQLRAAISQN